MPRTCYVVIWIWWDSHELISVHLDRESAEAMAKHKHEEYIKGMGRRARESTPNNFHVDEVKFYG